MKKTIFIIILLINSVIYSQKFVNIENKNYFFSKFANVNYKVLKSKYKIQIFNKEVFYLQYIAYYENYDTILLCAIHKSKNKLIPIILKTE